MLQRIQSVYLLLAALVAGVQFLPQLPLIRIEGDLTASGLDTHPFLADSAYQWTDHALLVVLTLLAAGTALGALGLFRNRLLQIKIARLAQLAFALLLLTAGILFYTALPSNSGSVNWTPAFGLAFPVLGILFSLLAIKGIRKDEALVRSMDRLR